MPVRSLRLPLWLAAALLVCAAAPDQVLARARRPFWLPLIASPASAQEVMKFEPMSAESAAAMEQRAARRARTVTPTAVPAVPALPGISVPEPAEPADAPSPPEVSRGGDLVRIGSDIHVEAGQVVEGDVFALRGDIRVDGHVKGNVATTGGDVHLGPTARVDGDLVCIGGELIEDPGAIVAGQRVTALRGHGDRRIAQRIRERLVEKDWEGRGRGGAVGFSFSWLIMSVVVAWAFTKIAPARTGVALEALRRKLGTSLGIGVLVVLLLGPSLIALALAMAILCITIVGIPLALLLMPAYGVFLALLVMWGFVLGASLVGAQVGGRWPGMAAGLPPIRRDAILGALVVGGMLLASSILHFMPFFGWVSTLVWVLGWVTLGLVTAAGMGALLSSKLGLGPRGRWWPPFASAPPPAPPPMPGGTPAPGEPTTPSMQVAPSMPTAGPSPPASFAPPASSASPMPPPAAGEAASPPPAPPLPHDPT